MLHIESIDEGKNIYHALSSEVRMSIISLLAELQELNMNELGDRLGIPNSTITAHIRILDECGLVDVRAAQGARGMQKLCSLRENRLLIELNEAPRKRNLMRFELPVGSYSNFMAAAPCGIATPSGIIGGEDSPCYFDAPERSAAGIVWFSRGFLEYPIPNYLTERMYISELQISMEVASSAPGDFYQENAAGLMFSINDMVVGSRVVRQDSENMHSLYSPAWWEKSWLQSGKIKLLTINKKGTFIDGGNWISGMTIEQLEITAGKRILLRIFSLCGSGVTIFGRGFGDYNQDISVRILYEER